MLDNKILSTFWWVSQSCIQVSWRWFKWVGKMFYSKRWFKWVSQMLCESNVLWVSQTFWEWVKRVVSQSFCTPKHLCIQLSESNISYRCGEILTLKCLMGEASPGTSTAGKQGRFTTAPSVHTEHQVVPISINISGPTQGKSLSLAPIVCIRLPTSPILRDTCALTRQRIYTFDLLCLLRVKFILWL